MALDYLHVNDLDTATLDDTDQIIVGEGNTFKKATLANLKGSIIGSEAEYTEDTVPYLSARKTKNSGIVGKVAMEQLVGGSFGWNQLNNYGQNSGTNNEVTYTKTASGWTVSGTAPSSGQSQYRTTTDIPCVSGHRYLCIANAVLSTNGVYVIIWRNNSATRAAAIGQNAAESLVMFTGGSDWTNINIWFHVPAGKTASNTNLVVNLFDLTAMFGSIIADYIYQLESATAGAGIAKLKSWGIDLDTYHAYDAGSIQSVEATAHVTTGKNLLPNTGSTTTENGITFTKQEDGSVVVNGTATATATYRMVTNGDEYRLPKGSYRFIGAKNANQSIGYSTTNGLSGYSTNAAGDIITFNEDVTFNYIFIRIGSGQSLSNVRFTPMVLFASTTDTTFEPYTAHTYPLGSDTLRGYPMLVNNELAYDGDVKVPDGTINRKYGIVDLGTLTWTYQSSSGLFYSGGYPAMKANTVKGILSNGMVLLASQIAVSATDKSLYKDPNGRLYAHDSAYTDSAAFQSAMSGVYMVYELATPTTETSTAYQRIQTVDADGTEEFVTDTVVPVGHVTQIPENVLGALSVLVG